MSSLLRRLPLALLALAACTPYRLPFTEPESPLQSTGAGVQADPHQATLVFVWPVTSCDPPGYLTLATANGQFIGTISRGSRLSALVPAGGSTVIAWNEVEEGARGSSKETIPILRADLREGRTYYARIVFGEWDERGPRARPLRDEQWVGKGHPFTTRACVAAVTGVVASLIAISPEREGWHDLPEWMAKLDAVVPDRAAGQAWLDEHRELVDAHLALSEARLVGLRPEERRRATLEPADGAPQ